MKHVEKTSGFSATAHTDSHGVQHIIGCRSRTRSRSADGFQAGSVTSRRLLPSRNRQNYSLVKWRSCAEDRSIAVHESALPSRLPNRNQTIALPLPNPQEILGGRSDVRMFAGVLVGSRASDRRSRDPRIVSLRLLTCSLAGRDRSESCREPCGPAHGCAA